MIDSVREGRGKFDPINPNYDDFQEERLSEMQRKAVKHVAKSQDWVTGVRGAAGTGKTTMMNLISGALKVSSGTISLQGRRLS